MEKNNYDNRYHKKKKKSATQLKKLSKYFYRKQLKE